MREADLEVLPIQVQAASPPGSGQGGEKGVAGEKIGEWIFNQTVNK